MRAVGGSLAAQPELLTGSIQLGVMDGRGRANSHHVEVGVGLSTLNGRGGSSSQKRQSESEELHDEKRREMMFREVGCLIMVDKNYRQWETGESL